jgi:hypothetical protein
MKVVVEIPEAAQGALPPMATLSRDLLEAYVIDRYRKGTMTQRQVGLILGLDRGSTEEFLRQHDVLKALTLEDLEFERSLRRRTP